MDIAILTPAYNRGSLLKRLYESLLKQTAKNFVWYIVDDGSTDNTKDYVESIAKNSEITIIYHYKQNGGKHTAINKGMQLIKEDVIAIVDSDDWLIDNCIEVIANDFKDIMTDDSLCGISYLKGNFAGGGGKCW